MRLALVGGCSIATISTLLALNGVLPATEVSSRERSLAFERCVALTQEREPSSPVEAEAALTECALSSTAGTSVYGDLDSLVREVFALRASSPVLRAKCHDSAHALGVVAFRGWGLSALRPGLEECGFGFYHGVMMSAASVLDPPQAAAQLTDFCLRFRDSDSPDWRAHFDFCVHGIGHAFGAQVTVADAVELCSLDSLADIGSYPVGHEYSVPVNCFTGALNEKLRYDFFDGSAPSGPAAAAAQCQGLTSGFLRVCTRYALHYSLASLMELRDFCESTSSLDVPGCWQAVGFRASSVMFERRWDPDFSEFSRPSSESLLSRDPESVARFVEEWCAGDFISACVERFSFETAQSTQDPLALERMCLALRDRRSAQLCTDEVLPAVSGIQGV